MTGAYSPCRACGFCSPSNILRRVRVSKSQRSLSSSIPWRDSSRSLRRKQTFERSQQPWTIVRTLFFAICFCVIFCSQGARAAADLDFVDGYLSKRSTLHFDDSEPPVAPMRFDQMVRRGNGLKSHHRGKHAFMKSSTRESYESGSPPTSTLASESTSTPSTTTTSLVTATSGPTTLPRPFDGALGSNFTAASCPAFFEKFLHDQQFNDCLPFSLLLQVCIS